MISKEFLNKIENLFYKTDKNTELIININKKLDKLLDSLNNNEPKTLIEKHYSEKEVGVMLGICAETVARKRKKELIIPSLLEPIRYTQADIDEYKRKTQPEKLNPKIKL